jgi:hypothetical protein
MRYNALNATKPATTKQDVKRMYVVRLLHCIVPFYFYIALCLVYRYIVLC